VTLKSTEAYNLGTQNVSKAVSKCMDDTLLLINKTDELNAEIAPIYTIATQMCAQCFLVRSNLGVCKTERISRRRWIFSRACANR